MYCGDTNSVKERKYTILFIVQSIQRYRSGDKNIAIFMSYKMIKYWLDKIVKCDCIIYIFLNKIMQKVWN